MGSDILAVDSVVKEYQMKIGETQATFAFALTNVSLEPLAIYDTSTTCDCTVAKMPSRPWMLPPGGQGEIRASIDLLRPKWSPVNYIIVFTSKGNKMLTVKVLLPKS